VSPSTGILVAAFLIAVRPVQSQQTAGAATASGVILGTVTDTSLRPLGLADVSIALSGIHVSADPAGRFQIERVPGGSYLLVVRRLGFRPMTGAVEVRAGDTLRLAFKLEPASTELPTVVVTERSASVRLKEFDERRKRGDGEFFTQEYIDKRNVVAVSDILREAKAVRIMGTAAASAREFRPCYMQVYLDGLPVQGKSPTLPPSLNDLPSPKDIMGIGAKRGCGAILLWTRDGSKP
jgi:hypothetical protein